MATQTNDGCAVLSVGDTGRSFRSLTSTDSSNRSNVSTCARVADFVARSGGAAVKLVTQDGTAFATALSAAGGTVIAIGGTVLAAARHLAATLRPKGPPRCVLAQGLSLAGKRQKASPKNP
jgi:uncharacterized membrane protein